MKRNLAILSFIFILVSFLNPISANQFGDKLSGEWYITATVTADVKYKQWNGSLVISKSGRTHIAVLDWTSSDGEWHVVQDMDVIKNDAQIILQATNVDILLHPNDLSEYAPDKFTFNLSERTEESFPVTAGDAAGANMVFTIRKLK